ncbi:MAG: DinB family protein [Planctomycetes bacterium]|nr:DinB family protein [Planctomycetota bacterium]
MDSLFQVTLTFRNSLISLVEPLSDEQWDEIPQGFNNNIRWNLTHLIVTPALLIYKLAGENSPLLSADFIDSARKGSNPESFSLNEDFGRKHLSELLIETVKQCQRDFADLEKKEFKSYETSTGYIIKDVTSALAYSNTHDGIHLGTISAIKKLLEQNG